MNSNNLRKLDVHRSRLDRTVSITELRIPQAQWSFERFRNEMNELNEYTLASMYVFISNTMHYSSTMLFVPGNDNLIVSGISQQ